ncbi:MAG: hypothetical protein D6730_06100 [Bacteroidetes bacterium]|nr:MAG: hypothetical protein D6730_06100 [Bacteroidota bacterium]
MSSKGFEEKMRARLSDARVVPDPALWQKLEARLGGRRPPEPLWVRRAEAALLLLLTALFFISFPAGNMLPESAQMVEQATDTAQYVPKAAPRRDTSPEALSQHDMPAAQQAQPSGLLPSPAPAAGRPVSPASAASATVSTPMSAIAPAPNQPPAAGPQGPAAQSAHHPQALRPLSVAVAGLQPPVPQAVPAPYPLPGAARPRWALYAHYLVENRLEQLKFFSALQEADLAINTPPSGGGDTLYTLQYPQSVFRAGIGISYALSPRWSLQAGIDYRLSKGGQIRQSIYPDGYPNNDPTQDPLTQPVEQASARTQLVFGNRQWAMPLYLTYQHPLGRSALGISAGVVPAFSPGKSPALEQFRETLRGQVAQGGSDIQAPPVFLAKQQFQLDLAARLQYHYRASRQLAFFAGPAFRYVLRPPYQYQAGAAQTPWQLDFRLGVMWYVGK